MYPRYETEFWSMWHDRDWPHGLVSYGILYEDDTMFERCVWMVPAAEYPPL